MPSDLPAVIPDVSRSWPAIAPIMARRPAQWLPPAIRVAPPGNLAGCRASSISLTLIGIAPPSTARLLTSADAGLRTALDEVRAAPFLAEDLVQSPPS